jgi:hypothetical protein
MRWLGRHRVRLDVEAVQDGVIRLPGDRFRAVLDVAGVPFGLMSETEQRVILANFATFLNSLSFPVQTLVRVLPVDIDGYLSRIEQRARHELPERLAALALEHTAFVRSLARSRNLLERHFYIVVPAQDAARLGLAGGLFRRRRDPLLQAEAARKQLSFRCDEMARQLARCGLGVRRLDDVELAALVYACWCPELSRLQRLHRDLAGYTSLLVRAAGSAIKTLTPTPGDAPCA